MNLVCDLLDQPVVDRDGHPSGRVDGIVLEVRDDAPPRVAALAIGPVVLGERLSPIIGRWVAALEQALGMSRSGTIEIRMSEARLERGHVRIREKAPSTLEARLRRWLKHVPGAGC